MIDYKQIYTSIFSNNPNYCHKIINQNEIKHQWLIQLCKHYKINSVVDIGSGTGAMLSYFTNTAVEVLATDLSNFLLYDFPFKAINLSEDLLLDKVYDLVICCDVIEHLSLPDSVLVLDKIKPYGKKFLIAIANHSDIIDGIELHLTREDKNFWDYEISKRFDIKSSGSYYNNKLYMYEVE